MSLAEKKKRKKNEPSPTLTSLPDDLLLSCLARVSRLYYPTTLSLVSKRFQSLLASPDLYKVRSLLGHTESCLYVCIEFRYTRSPIWFTLCRKPDQTLTNDTSKSKKKKSGGYVLAKVSIPDSPPANAAGLVAVGSSIYNICGTGPLLSFSASLLDQKIYAAGCYIDKDGSLKNTFEMLDTKTLIWNSMPTPCSDTYNFFDHKSVCVNGKFHVKTSKGGEVVAYNSKEGRWDLVESQMGHYMHSQNTYCVIENVLYSAYNGDIKWYDTEVREWRQLKGLVRVLTCVRIFDYGGKMVVWWDGKFSSCSKTNIWFSEITLEKRKNGEIWGRTEWYDHVLTVPNSYYLIKALVVTV